MKRRFILYRRKRGGMFYVEDTETRKQESLGTRDRAEAMSLLNARNESVRQPQLNLHIAKAYLAGTDSGVSTRTWQNALDAIIESKGLKQMNDSGALEKIIDEVIAANADNVAQFRAGKDKAFNALVGQIMKASKGKANPQQVNDLLRARLTA